ncbi:LexA family transcriptional regulator [Desulfolutivibrio sp.]|uniref:LexA family transcriptional regulator n=1 Tax=Desulfolutivibrio sp. TaxID=2773296 RepID=UPI002F967117
MSGEFDAFFLRAQSACGVKSQSDLANLLGLHRSAVTQAKNKGLVPKVWALTLSRLFGADPQWLLTGRAGQAGQAGQVGQTGQTDQTDQAGQAGHVGAGEAVTEAAPEGFLLVPKVRARISAGGGSLETEAGVSGYFAFRSEWLRRKGRPERMVLMDVVGVSMEPEIRHGDMVLIDQSQSRIFAHAVYAFGVDDTVLVKRVEKRPGMVVLLSDNRDYAPIELRGQEIEGLRIIGRVVWVGREL